MDNRDEPIAEAIPSAGGWRNSLVLFVASCAGLGRLPLFPGTWGTSLGLIIFLIFHQQINLVTHTIIIISLFFLGVWVSREAEMILGKKDHSSIVIDELVGFFIAVCLLPYQLNYILGAFIIFRILDIWKPWSSLESLKHGWGVMVDDLVAGIATNVLLRLYIFIF
jgi:phosphatidylglycerophosphatase A